MQACLLHLPSAVAPQYPSTNLLYPSNSVVQVETELKAAGLSKEAISGIMTAMQVRTLQDLEGLLGHGNTAVQQLQRLFELAAGYGYDNWLVFDASIVRGLAYYTGGPIIGLTTSFLRSCSHAEHACSLRHACSRMRHACSRMQVLQAFLMYRGHGAAAVHRHTNHLHQAFGARHRTQDVALQSSLL